MSCWNPFTGTTRPDWRVDWPALGDELAHPVSPRERHETEIARSQMTERRLKHRFHWRPDRSSGAMVALPGIIVLHQFHMPPLVPIVPMANQASNAGIGLIIAIGVSTTVGVALIAYLIRPLLAKLSSDQPSEPNPHDDVHGERWARWEAGAAETARPENGSGTSQPARPSNPSNSEDDVMIETAMPIDLPPDQAAPASGGSGDTSVRSGISATVSTLLDCANEGAMLSGFGLYTDRFFQKFAQESGLSLDEFIRRYQGPGLSANENRSLVANMESVTTLPDGRISANVVYGPNGALPPERYIFSWSPERGRWLIDDIVSEG
jgi:hypothetical protein